MNLWMTIMLFQNRLWDKSNLYSLVVKYTCASTQISIRFNLLLHIGSRSQFFIVVFNKGLNIVRGVANQNIIHWYIQTVSTMSKTDPILSPFFAFITKYLSKSTTLANFVNPRPSDSLEWRKNGEKWKARKEKRN